MLFLTNKKIFEEKKSGLKNNINAKLNNCITVIKRPLLKNPITKVDTPLGKTAAAMLCEFLIQWPRTPYESF